MKPGIQARKGLPPSDRAALEQHLLAFGRRYQQIGAPLQWRFTRQDLHKLLANADTAQPSDAAA